MSPEEIAELKEKFSYCEALINEKKVHVPESVEMRIYGLRKQIRQGECTEAKPSA